MRVSPLFFLLLAALCSSESKAEGNIKLKLSFETEVSASGLQLPTKGALQFVMKGRDVDVYASEFGQWNYIGSKSVGHGFFYGPVDFSVQASPRALNFTGSYRTHIETAHITTDGVSQCHASLAIRLRPGQSQYDFVVAGANVHFNSVRYTNVRCELSTS